MQYGKITDKDIDQLEEYFSYVMTNGSKRLAFTKEALRLARIGLHYEAMRKEAKEMILKFYADRGETPPPIVG